MIKVDSDKLKKLLLTTGLVFLVIIILWPVTMILAPGAEGTMAEQLDEIKANLLMYQLSFIMASLIAPSIFALMIVFTLFVDTQKKTPLLNIMGLVLLVIYMVFVTISYTSQYTYFISLLENGSNSIDVWYFGNFDSLAYFFNQLGYTFFGLAGILFGYRYCFERGIKKVYGIVIEVCSVLSIVAWFGLVIGSTVINMATLISGILTIPLGVIAIIMSQRLDSNVTS